ncbi:MAG: CHAT domain-containing protein [Longimicrobiaceae bacterium]
MNRFQLLLLGAGIALAVTIATIFRGISHLNVSDGAAASAPARVFSPRLSIAQAFRPCTMLRVRRGETVPRERCDTHEVPLVNLAALADSAESSDPHTLQAAALRALTAPNSTELSVNVAITMLSRALRQSSNKVPLLVDLSGAYLVRAEQTDNPRDQLEALDYALQALTREPRNPAALFNSALALEAWGLDKQAALTWTDYLRVDSTSEWAGEATQRLRGLQDPPPLPPAPGPESSLDQVRAFAMRDPQGARLLGWDFVLGQWGTAQEAGKTEEAARLLQLADRLGAVLVSRSGDASLADAVKAIRAAADDPAATLTLARAHRMYARAQALYLNPDLRTAAGDTFAHVVDAQPRSPTLVQWAEAFQAATEVYKRNYRAADSASQALLARIDSVRHPALAARVWWMRSTALLHDNDYIRAREASRSAAGLFERAGETEFAAYAHAQGGEAAFYPRDTTDAYSALHRGLTGLHRYRSSKWLHNALFVLANTAAADGMPLAAEKIRDEDMSVTKRLPPISAVEAVLGRARIRALIGQRREAARDLDSAAARLAGMGNSEPHEHLDATVSYLRALLAPDSSSMAHLDSAVDLFNREKTPDLLIPALLGRADLRLAAGELAGATADLNAATERIRDLAHDQKQAFLRVAMMEQVRSRFNQLVMIHLGAGDTIEALRAVERGRVSFAPGTPATTPRRLAAPRGQVALEYALIGDTLLTWTIRGNDVRLRRAMVDRGDLLQRIERVNTSLESRARESLAGPDLVRLYDLLVRPVERELGPPDTPLVILADGEVAGVPFAVLRDSARGRYLLEVHPHRFAATLADAARPAPPAGGVARRTLLVADPAFDPDKNPGLDRLRGARAEVDSLGTLYPDSMLLAGTGATRQALVQRAPRAGIIHYAGHAVFDDTRPERSFLVLADSDTTGHLTAEAVNGLRLDGVRLVVLSACSTIRSRDGRSGGFSGFSGALLGAGAGGVVGSLWQVNDSLTTPFMLAFHRAYLQTGDPAAALREAQREMLRAKRPLAIWAGFRYVGR